MKIFIVLFVSCIVGVLAGQLTEEQEKALEPIREQCLKETSTNGDLVKEIEKKVPLEYDESVNCFSACMLKNIGLMTQDGRLDEDVVRALLSSNIEINKLDKAIENCKAEVGKDDCETAGKLIKCFLKNDAALS